MVIYKVGEKKIPVIKRTMADAESVNIFRRCVNMCELQFVWANWNFVWTDGTFSVCMWVEVGGVHRDGNVREKVCVRVCEGENGGYLMIRAV